MNASHEWLRQFVDAGLSAAAVRDLLTARCATVEELHQLRADLAGIVVGLVVEAGPHPDSDHLWVTKVDAGDAELVSVVCGAPVVTTGARYPFAPVGTVLPGGLKLDRRKIRGQLSNGMLCSARELGLGDEHEGILELDTDAAPGTPFLDVYAAGDVRLVVDVLPDRPDLLSHRGIAREIAAATAHPLGRPAELGERAGLAWSRDAREASVDGVTVRVDAGARTPVYAGVVLRGVTVGPSPRWLAERLEAVGARAINNVVDVTNYMLHAFGQPMHAFDLARLDGAAVVVRPAREGERLVTLDGAARVLRAGTTVIADAQRPHAVAGVMGGVDSEVGPRTTDLFLEIAVFDPHQVRATRRALGLSTDASFRFERGLDRGLPLEVAADAAGLLLAVSGGKLHGAVLIEAEPAHAAPALVLRTERVARLLGVPLPTATIAALLAAVGFASEPAPDGLSVTVPGWRLDVLREVDLIEEVARLHGYDRIPDEIRPFRPGTVPDAPLVATSARLRDALVAEGLYEARPLPFVPASGNGGVAVRNPLGENESCLRATVLETLARRAEHNLAQMQGNVRLFEIGTVFRACDAPLPDEALHLGVLIMGDRRPPHFTEPKPPHFDAWDAKGLALRAATAAFPRADVRLGASDDPADLWRIVVDDEPVGRVMAVTLDAPVWAAPAFGIELRVGDVRTSSAVARNGTVPRYRPLPTTPAAAFDLALVVAEATGAATVEAAIRDAAGDLLERLELFDEYRGTGVPAGHRSLAWRLTFRHAERTLRDKEIEGRRARLLRALEEIGVTPRG